MPSPAKWLANKNLIAPMSLRQLLVPAALATVVGVPLIALQPEASSRRGNFGSLADWADPNGAFGGETEMLYVPVGNLGEILRFDVYPNWVKSRWPRVSTAPASDGMQGMRVAVVTGANPWDIAGSLTYYFDANHRAQRIILTGQTGDASQLVSFLTSQFGFQAHPTISAGLFTARSRRQIVGALNLNHPVVIDAAAPNSQVQLLLELNRPDAGLELSQATASQLPAGL
jgi:hypothetical protein